MGDRSNVAPLRICAVQSSIWANDVAANLSLMARYVEQYAHESDLIIFPETITTGFSSEAASLADGEDRKIYHYLAELSAKHGVALAGSYLAQHDGQAENLFFLISPEEEAQFQGKRHLFAPGEERGYVHPARERSIFTYRGWRILPTVCYDLRFPVWCRNVDCSYDLLINVANWPTPRREVYKTLLRARAMENLSYVVGVNRVGTDLKGLSYSGDSVVLDAKGKPLAEAREGMEEAILATLDLQSLLQFQQKFPVWADADRFTLQL